MLLLFPHRRIFAMIPCTYETVLAVEPARRHARSTAQRRAGTAA